jgi:hypothetical protein
MLDLEKDHQIQNKSLRKKTSIANRPSVGGKFNL